MSIRPPSGGGGGAVDSVDGLTGAVVLSGSYAPLTGQGKAVEVRNLGNYTTTSTTRTPVDATNLPYQTLTLAVGDIVELIINCAMFNSGVSAYTSVDVEVDQPTSANIYVYDNVEKGMGTWNGNGGPHCFAHVGFFTATEAGAHGFRPVWFVSATTGTMCNATSGGNDHPISFIARKIYS